MIENIDEKPERIFPKGMIALSFELLKDYFKQFTGTLFIAVISSILIWIITLFLSGSLMSLFLAESFYTRNIALQEGVFFFLLLPGFFVLFSFIGSGFGMAKEIITEGDYYVSLKSSFYYFKKHWLGYSGLAIIFLIIFSAIDSIFPEEIILYENIFLFLIIITIESFIEILTLSLMGLVPVALTNGNSFFKSFKKAWEVFKGNWRSIFKSMALILVPFNFFCVMYGPILSLFVKNNIWGEVYIISWLIIFLGVFFIYFPLIIIHLTILYQRFSTVTQNLKDVK